MLEEYQGVIVSKSSLSCLFYTTNQKKEFYEQVEKGYISRGICAEEKIIGYKWFNKPVTQNRLENIANRMQEEYRKAHTGFFDRVFSLYK